MPGKQANEQGYRRGSGRGFENCSMRRMQNKKNSSNGHGWRNHGNNQSEKIRKRGSKYSQSNENNQPLTETNEA